jgi:hypothetical protein
MSATVKQNKTKMDLRNVTWVRPEKDHLTPEVKMVNKIVCDHVWDKMYPPFLAKST